MIGSKNYNKEVSIVPMGKFVIITYDSFYKSYDLTIQSAEGVGFLKFNYISKEADGTIKVVESKYHEIHYIVDKLSTDGSLKILNSSELDGG